MAIKQRARSAQDKEQRISSLLEAARALARDRGVAEVTLTAVTASIGLHPSALRRYFESREELLLQLAEEGWVDWEQGMTEVLGEARELDAAEAADRIAASFERLPVFCDLMTHVALSLEGAVRIERARKYKLAATASFDAMADVLRQAVAGLDLGSARDVLATALSCAAYQYQLSRPTETLRQLYAENPRWSHDALSFRPHLAELLTHSIRGAQRLTR
jgi:AcrR family transcriptional regulator